MNFQSILVAYLHILFVAAKADDPRGTLPVVSLLNDGPKVLDIGLKDVTSILSRGVGTGDLDRVDDAGPEEFIQTVPQATSGILSGSAFQRGKSDIVSKFPTNIQTKDAQYLAALPLRFNGAALLEGTLCNYNNTVRITVKPSASKATGGPLGNSVYTLIYENYEWECPKENETNCCRAGTAINGEGGCVESSFVVCNTDKYGCYENCIDKPDGCILVTSPFKIGSPSPIFQLFVNELEKVLEYNTCTRSFFYKYNLRFAVDPIVFLYYQNGEFYDQVLGKWIKVIIITNPKLTWPVASYEQLQTFCKLKNAYGRKYTNKFDLHQPQKGERARFAYGLITTFTPTN